MESTNVLLRIGEKAKELVLGPYERSEVSFNLLSIQSGIFEFPPIRVYVDGIDLVVSTSNYLIYSI